jgi:hypothetical protein
MGVLRWGVEIARLDILLEVALLAYQRIWRARTNRTKDIWKQCFTSLGISTPRNN